MYIKNFSDCVFVSVPLVFIRETSFYFYIVSLLMMKSFADEATRVASESWYFDSLKLRSDLLGLESILLCFLEQHRFVELSWPSVTFDRFI